MVDDSVIFSSDFLFLSVQGEQGIAFLGKKVPHIPSAICRLRQTDSRIIQDRPYIQPGRKQISMSQQKKTGNQLETEARQQPPQKATIYDIAKLSGVSTATVSRYYSGSRIVSDAVGRRIEAAAEQTGYRYSHKNHRYHSVIAVLVPEFGLAYFYEVLREIADQMPRCSFRMVFIPYSDRNSDYKKFFDEMAIDGVIYLDENISEDILRYISSKNIRMVLCGGVTADHRSDAVHINDMAAAWEGTKYLLGLGHEKILFLSDYSQSLNAGFQRLVGCRRAMEQASLTWKPAMVRMGPLTYDVGYRLTRTVLQKSGMHSASAADSGTDILKTGEATAWNQSSELPFSAVFAFSDEMAFGVIHALQDIGLCVPDDVSVLGFDDIRFSGYTTPGLSTIHQPIREIVEETLLLFQNKTPERKRIDMTLPYKIVEWGSCAPYKAQR